jgi:hypothetical protein
MRKNCTWLVRCNIYSAINSPMYSCPRHTSSKSSEGYKIATVPENMGSIRILSTGRLTVSPGLKRPEREVKHSSPSSTEVTNVHSLYSIAQSSWHDTREAPGQPFAEIQMSTRFVSVFCCSPKHKKCDWQTHNCRPILFWGAQLTRGIHQVPAIHRFIISNCR